MRDVEWNYPPAILEVAENAEEDGEGFCSDLKEFKQKRDDVAHQNPQITVEEAENKNTINMKVEELEELNNYAYSKLIELLAWWNQLDGILNKLNAEPMVASTHMLGASIYEIIFNVRISSRHNHVNHLR